MRVILTEAKWVGLEKQFTVYVVHDGKRVKCGKISWNPDEGEAKLAKIARRKARSTLKLQQN